MQTLGLNGSTSQTGGPDVESRQIGGLVKPFEMLSVRISAPPSYPAVQQHQGIMDPSAERARSDCRARVLTALPDIEPEFLSRLCNEAYWDPNLAIDRILDQVESGQPYPKVPKPNLKRKRQDDEDTPGPETAAKKFDNDERRSQRKTNSYLTTT